MLETDVRLTKDNVLIVCHDEDLVRLCGKAVKVRETNFADLPKLLNKMPMHFSALNKDAEFKTYERKKSDQDRFSSLEEVFTEIGKEIPFSIELKDQNCPEAAKALIELIQKFDRHQTTAIGGEEVVITKQLLALDNGISTFCGKQDLIKITIAYLTGFLHYLHIDREVAALPYMTKDFIKMKETEREAADTLFKKGFLTFYIYVGQLANMTFNNALLHLQRRGIYTIYWVLNEEAEMLHLVLGSKVEGIMTDRPELLRAYVDKQNLQDQMRKPSKSFKKAN